LTDTRDRHREEDIMNRMLSVCVLALLALAAVSRPSAQILNEKAPIRVGHYHLNVTNVDEHKKFWVDTLGGTAAKFGDQDVIRFGDVLLFLRVQKPTGGTRGTTFDHIGLAAPDVPALTKKVVAAGYKLTEGRAGQGVPDTGPSAVYGRFSYLLGPDDVKVEIVTAADPKTAPPIAHHHVHYINPQYVEMRNWYVKALDATERTGPNTFTDFFAGADLPGIGYMLNFFRWELDGKLTGTAGRAVDHVGFEVRNLEAFAKGLAAKGITVTQPYRRSPEMNNIGTVMLVDPWGTVVELTEGLERAL
jgi:catechol 2,3-dioxygenase-like lactoylglutathione lyase family enzyme